MQNLKTLFFLVLLSSFITASGQNRSSEKASDSIRLNQVGFYPEGPKTAVIVNPKAQTFEIIRAGDHKKVFSGNLSAAKEWPYSGETVKQADFSAYTTPGKYLLHVPGTGNSYPFSIENHALKEPAKASLKAFYYQRASTDLPEKYAGKWARMAGHPDNKVKVHNSAATATRPAGSLISSPKGWYDAGDYGKYVVNSGITMGTLFSLFEDFPEYMKNLRLNIPESDNQLPDILDETLWNLRWMMSMQDEDGGVYHKLTSANFHPMVMPAEAKQQRWVVQKSTAATLDFAAVSAQASRIFKKYEKELPGLSDSLLVMSKNAYQWAKEHPGKYYNQRELKDPAVSTGAYGDRNVKDEFQWAATELFITTGNARYYDEASIEEDLNSFQIPSWPNVNTLALYSLLRNREKYEDQNFVNTNTIQKHILAMADELVEYSKTSAYGVPMGVKNSDFAWGSNSETANQGILLIQAYLLTQEEKYLDAATANLDYLLGRNATGYSFLTGFGEKSTRHPHHRPSESDNIEDPVPGLLAGGPNPGQQDKAGCDNLYTEKHNYPATSYIDESCSYASNEIAINWNAPFVYLANAIEAIRE
ncbi:glycoside hydrolase family 9 protein [Zunongwangia sp. H14]|uniref:glycoside hydrolase family 9 protein n=1 Tax=Zunongwangia sp. H14 TaxID=3240792 RepID=UPI0035666F20